MNLGKIELPQELMAKMKDFFLDSAEFYAPEKLILMFCKDYPEYTSSMLKEHMVKDSWLVRRASMQLQQAEMVKQARMARFINRKLDMDEKALDANEKILDIILEKTNNQESLRVSDIERLANATAKIQVSNNDIINGNIQADETKKKLLKDESEEKNFIDLSKVPKEVLEILYEKGMING